MTTTGDAQKITRTDELREYESFARRVRADQIRVNFEDKTSTNTWTAVSLTQVDQDGDEIESDDPRYAILPNGNTLNRAGLLNICADVRADTDDVDFRIRVRTQPGANWVTLATETGVSSIVNMFDDVDGHGQLQVQIKSSATDTPGSASAFLLIQ